MVTQPELKGMPAKTKSTLKAEEVVELFYITEDKKSMLEKRRAALISQMKADNLKEVKCLSPEGRVFKFSIENPEKLKMEKPKAE